MPVTQASSSADAGKSQRRRPLRVKMILPSLIEANVPGYRPIKYALFPPLGLASLAAYLDPDDEAERSTNT